MPACRPRAQSAASRKARFRRATAARPGDRGTCATASAGCRRGGPGLARRAMDACEPARIEPLLQLLEGTAQEVAAACAVHLDVVVLRLDPIDLLDGDHPDALPIGD